MNLHRRLVSLHILAAAVLVALCSASAVASTIPAQQPDGPLHTFTYSTFLSNTEATTSWAPSISFQGVQNQSVQSTAPFGHDSFPYQLPEGSTADFPLGKITFGVPGIGIAGEYNAVDYDITVQIDAVDGVALTTPMTTVVQGRLLGDRLDPDGRQFVHGLGSIPYLGAPFDPPGLVGMFPDAYDGVVNYIIEGKDGSTSGFLDLSSPQEIVMTAQFVSELAINTPEPSTWAVFALVGVGAWRTSRGRAGSKPRSS